MQEMASQREHGKESYQPQEFLDTYDHPKLGRVTDHSVRNDGEDSYTTTTTYENIGRENPEFLRHMADGSFIEKLKSGHYRNEAVGKVAVNPDGTVSK